MALNAYLPRDTTEATIALLVLPIVLIVGYFLTRIRSVVLARSLSWLLVIAGTGGMERYTVSQPPGFRMLMIIGILLYTMKIVVASETRLSGKASLNFLQWISFAGFWVGMRPALFTSLPSKPRAEALSYYWRGTKNLVLGMEIVLCAHVVWRASNDWDGNTRLLVTTALLLPGLSLTLHFGVFHLMTGFWRCLGVNCDAIFRSPLKSRSLTEFWGKRWNLAFSEMTTLAVYRPLRGRFGQVAAMLTAFVFSGLLHEVAISVPVRAGFGWPLLYFLLHGGGMLIENHWTTLNTLIESRPWVGRLWTLAWLMAPLPLLFHQPFLRGCIWPIIGMES